MKGKNGKSSNIDGEYSTNSSLDDGIFKDAISACISTDQSPERSSSDVS